MGSSQSAGRAMVGVFAPRQRLAEYYGLWTFATSLASIVGPLTYGAVTWLTAGNHRLAIASTGVFFVVGWLAMRPIDVRRGADAAANA
jgi:UMF1 family MFS transporter